MLTFLKLIESGGPWGVVPEIKTALALVAFALAVILSVMLAWVKSKRAKIPNAFWGVVIALVVVAVGATLYKPSDIYRVRVTVINPEQVPVEDAKVWSSVGGEPKKVAGGWQFDIPDASKPQGGKLTIFAVQENAFLTGKTELLLNGDSSPSVTIRLEHDSSARVRGQVTDGNGRAVAGARVFIVGYEGEAEVTKTGGNFELPAHAAMNQQVLVVAEETNTGVARLWHPAGNTPVQLVLHR